MTATQAPGYEQIWVEGMNRGDVSAADQVFTSDCIIHVTGFAEPIVGLDAWKAAATGFLAAFPDMHITIDEQISVGDTTVTRWHGRATHNGPFGPIPPTGTIHFLIGKLEKMNLPANLPNGETDDPVRNPSTFHMFDLAESNLVDPNALWVSISRMGGGVTTVENDPPPSTVIGMSPTSVTIFPAEQPPSGGGRRIVLNPQQYFLTGQQLMQYLQTGSGSQPSPALDTYLYYSRTIATSRDQMQGQ